MTTSVTSSVSVGFVIKLIASKAKRMAQLIKAGAHNQPNWNFLRPKPLMMRGAPGITKTESLRALCRENNWYLLTRNVGNLLVEEFGGIPQFVEKGGELHTRWSIPEVIVELREQAAKHEVVMFLLDDFHRASPEVQSTGFETFTDFSMKGIDLPPNVIIVLAGNNSMKAGAKGFLSAIMNRISMWDVELDKEQWLQNMGEHLHPLIVSFFMNDSNAIYLQEAESSDGPWSSARSWTNLSNEMKDLEAIGMNLDEAEQIALYTSQVGKVGASQFQLYVQLYNKQDLTTFFDKKRIEMPDLEEGLARYAYVAALTMEIVNRARKGLWTKAQDNGLFMEMMAKLREETPELMTCSLYIMKGLAAKNQVLHDLAGAGVLNEKFIADNLSFIRDANA